MSSASPREIHAVLIPVGGSRVLLPNAIVAEIASLDNIETIDNAPSWLLGRIPWRDHEVPVVSFSGLTGTGAKEDLRLARVAVLRTLDGRSKLPHIGFISQGLPRLTMVTPDLLVRTDDGEQLASGIGAHVLVRSDQAVIPDLHWIENKIAQALDL
ncbi:MAG: chemotaxis protein CheW [Proteobacteria bacterium]|nr:chemotaxis protein CheW [Pseudomonadota bacterium]